MKRKDRSPESGDDREQSDHAAEAVRIALPRYVVLESDWAGHLAGKVLQADEDLLSALDIAGVRYRVATARERRIAGLS